VLQLRREQSGPSCAPLRVLAQNDRQARAESPTIAAPTTARGEIAFPRRVFLSFYPSPPPPILSLSLISITLSVPSCENRSRSDARSLRMRISVILLRIRLESSYRRTRRC